MMMIKFFVALSVLVATAEVGAFVPTSRTSAPRQIFSVLFPSEQDSSSSSESNASMSLEVADPVAAPPIAKSNEVVLSKAIPFLSCPKALVGCDLAGNVGFDPFGFAETKEQLWTYREAEVKHARLAMLAAAGWPISEMVDRQIADFFGVSSFLDPWDRVPTVLNGGLDRVSPVFWGACLGLTAAIDMYGIAKARSGDPSYFPGKLDFDPLGLYPSDKKGRKSMELAEIKHGRLAMIAVLGYTAEEYLTKVGVVDEFPFFYFL